MHVKSLLFCAAISVGLPAAGFAQVADRAPAAAPTTSSDTAVQAPSVAGATMPTGDDPATGATGAAAPTTTGGLVEIVVTAQRRSESLQKAAVAVAVVSPAQLSRVGLTQPTQLGALVPALSVQPNGGANTIFFLRGVGNFTVNGYSDPAVAFNYDGIYIGRPTGTFGYFYDLERIEVLKGPQGTVYGRNATGGVINVLPAKPVLGKFSGSLIGSYGNYNSFDVQGALNVPVGQDTAFRIAGSVRGHDGYLTDGLNDDRGWSVRAQGLTELIPNVTLRISGDYSHAGGNGQGASYAAKVQLNSSRTGYDIIPSGLAKSNGLLDPASQNYRSTQLYSPINGRFGGPLLTGAYLDNAFYGTEGQIDWATDLGTLTVVPGMRWSDLNNLYVATGSNQYIQEHDKQFSLEARWTGKRIAIFDYLIGLYYFNERVDGNYTFNQQVFSAYQDFRSTTKSYAAFARLTANISDRLRAVGAIRYTADHKYFNGAADVLTVVCTRPATPTPACPTAPLVPLTDRIDQLPFPVPARGGAPLPFAGTGAIGSRGTVIVNQKLRSNQPTYRAALEFDVAPRSLAYASYESGYRSGGYSLSAGHETFQPEYIDAYTIGLKNRFLDNRIQLNVEAFLWKYRNQQVSHSGIDTNGVNGVFTDNAGRSTNKGVEVEGQFLLTPNTLLNFDVQYLRARFKSFVFALPRGATPPITGCSFSINPGNANQYLIDCSGRQGYQSPTWTVNLGGQQTFPIGQYKIIGAVDTQYRTSRFVGFDYEPWEFVRPTWTTNLNVTLTPKDERFSVGFYLRNLENNRIVTSAFLLTTGAAGLQLTTAPRTYGIQGSLKF